MVENLRQTGAPPGKPVSAALASKRGSMSDNFEMPDDWDDHAGWEAYFAALPSDDFWYKNATTSPGSLTGLTFGRLPWPRMDDPVVSGLRILAFTARIFFMRLHCLRNRHRTIRHRVPAPQSINCRTTSRCRNRREHLRKNRIACCRDSRFPHILWRRKR